MTGAPSPLWRNGTRYQWIIVGTRCFLVLFAAKLLLIARYGDPTPHSDEWAGDGLNFLIPLLHGRWAWRIWVAPHNEHRILLTRLVIWVILKASGRWDLIAQVELNAALHAISLVLIAFMLADAASGRRDPVAASILIAFAIVANAIPFSFDNTLHGFQSQFYFLIALSFASIALLVPSAAFSFRWWAGLGVGTLALFSVASGALSFCPSIGVALLQALRGQRRGRREIAGLCVLMAVTAALVCAVPTVPMHDIYRAHSVRQLLWAFAHASAWPFGAGLCFVAQGPAVVASTLIIWESTGRSDRSWYLVAGLLWIMVQVLLLSWSRALSPIESRYMDLFIIGQMVGAASALSLLRLKLPVRLDRRIVASAVAVWFLAIMAGYLQAANRFLPRNLPPPSTEGLASVAHLRAYLAHAPDPLAPDEAWMANIIPDTGLVRDVLDDPAIRAVLPGRLGGRAPENWMAWLEAHVIAAGPYILLAGLVILVLSGYRLVTSERRRSGLDRDDDGGAERSN